MNEMIPVDDKKTELIKNTICREASHEELEIFLHVCARTGLDPFMRQIYPVMRNVKISRNPDKWGKVMIIQTGIDGFRLIAERTQKYTPGREPTFVYDAHKKMLSATSYVKKLTSDGQWHEVAATAYFEEYVQKDKDGNPSDFWRRMPHLMLAKCAESLALRRAFPAELSGIYTSDEMSQADTIDLPTTPPAISPPPPVDENVTEEQLLTIQSKADLLPKEEIEAILKARNLKSFAEVKKKQFQACVELLEGEAKKALEKELSMTDKAPWEDQQ